MKASRLPFQRGILSGLPGGRIQWAAINGGGGGRSFTSIFSSQVAEFQSFRRDIQNLTGVLGRDHHSVDTLLERAMSGPAPSREMQRDYLTLAFKEIAIHNFVEDSVLLPQLNELLQKEGSQISARLRKSHEEIERLLTPIYHFVISLSDNSRVWPGFPNDQISELRGAFLKHAAHVEEAVLPLIKQRLSPDKLEELANKLENARNNAPTMPSLSKNVEAIGQSFVVSALHTPDFDIKGNASANTPHLRK